MNKKSSNNQLDNLLEDLYCLSSSNNFLLNVVCDVLKEKLNISKEELDKRFREKILLSQQVGPIN